MSDLNLDRCPLCGSRHFGRAGFDASWLDDIADGLRARLEIVARFKPIRGGVEAIAGSEEFIDALVRLDSRRRVQVLLAVGRAHAAVERQIAKALRRKA